MAVSVGLAAMGMGCAGDGLSPREKPQAYADTIYQGGPGLPPQPPAAVPTTQPAGPAGRRGTDLPVAPRFAVSGPISVAVVQMGEVAPPETAIRAFTSRPDLFAKVDPLAGRVSPDGQATADDLTAYRTAAANLGDDYVLVYGGTLDHGHVTTALSVFDLTIIGAFVVPSEQVTVTGRAAGSLVDVRTGRLGFGVTAEREGHHAPASGVGVGHRGTLGRCGAAGATGQTRCPDTGPANRGPPAGVVTGVTPPRPARS